LRFFDGLELIEPGLAMLDNWHPEPDDPDGREIPAHCAIARKP
jgi:hypothetical protein